MKRAQGITRWTAKEILADIERRLSPEVRERMEIERVEYERARKAEADEAFAKAEGARYGRVYFIEATGTNRIKIGWTRNGPGPRMKMLQTGCPVDLVLLASARAWIQSERRMHERFAALRVRPDGEWFEGAPVLRAFIARVARRYGAEE